MKAAGVPLRGCGGTPAMTPRIVPTFHRLTPKQPVAPLKAAPSCMADPLCLLRPLPQVERERERFSVSLKQSLCGSRDAALLQSYFRRAGSGAAPSNILPIWDGRRLWRHARPAGLCSRARVQGITPCSAYRWTA